MISQGDIQGEVSTNAAACTTYTKKKKNSVLINFRAYTFAYFSGCNPPINIQFARVLSTCYTDQSV